MNAKSFQRRSKLHRCHCFHPVFYPAVMMFEEVHIPLNSENKREPTSHWLAKTLLDTLRHSHNALFCDNRRRYDVLVDTTFTLCSVRPHNISTFKYTAQAVPSSTYVLSIPLQLFWEPNPPFTHRRHFVHFTSLLSRRVASRYLWRTY